jgi:predicted O-methyltransferase YrrM
MAGLAEWTAVDDYIDAHLLGEDAVLDAALATNAAAGLPQIDVSPAQGKMLHLFARMADARRILEIGTLGGYSTIALARSVREGGCVVSLELDPNHARVARENIARAGVSDRVDIRVGAALDTLRSMTAFGEAPFDLIFIDADKENNAAYLRCALALSRPGTTIVVDNVIREGQVLDAASKDPRIHGVRSMFDLIADEPRLSATAVQTVGMKGWDGFVLAVVGQG